MSVTPFLNGTSNGALPAPIDPYAPPAPTPPAPVPSITPADVFARWKTDGPLVHERTGLDALDALTGGGPVYGSRWYILGAPDAGKTALLVQIAHVWLQLGIAVGILAVDEEADDIMTRLAQRIGFSRQECEARNPAVIDRMAEALSELPLRLFPPGTTIEDAARGLAEFRAERKATRSALIVDSIQMVTCDVVVAGEKSPRETISANVRAARAAGAEHKHVVLSTSEMNRSSYRSIEAIEQSNDMAAGKESGAIEYSARVMLVLRSVKDHPDLTQLRIVKNKHGASHPRADDIYLSIDRSKQIIAVAPAPAETLKSDAEFVKRQASVQQIVIDNPGASVNRVQVVAKARNIKIGGVSTVEGILESLVAARKIEAREGVPPRGGKKTALYYPLELQLTKPVEPRVVSADAMQANDIDIEAELFDLLEQAAV